MATIGTIGGIITKLQQRPYNKKVMKKIFIFLTIISLGAAAQETVYPAPKQAQPVAITNATVHVGNGQVLNNATVVMTDGKITAVGTNITVPPGAQIINA